MNFEDLNNTTQIRLRNNGINSEDDLINQLLDRIVELEEQGLSSKNKELLKLESEVDEIKTRVRNASISIESVDATLDI